LKIRIAETQKREKEMQDRAEIILSEAKKREGDADRKLARANQLIAEYQKALTEEVTQVKKQIQKKLQEESDKILRRKSRQLSSMTVVLLIAYLIQMVALLFLEKDDIVVAIPVWFQDRYRNVQWLSQRIENFYQGFYLKITTSMPARVVIGILILVSVTIAVVLFFFIRMGLRHLLQKWKKWWEFYDCRDVELIKKCAMVEIAFMGFSVSTIIVNLPFIPFKLNVVSWWIFLISIVEYMYLNDNRNNFY